MTVLLLLFSPAVSGAPDTLLPHSDWWLFPLRSPGAFSIPAGFLPAWLGSRLGEPGEREDPWATGSPGRPARRGGERPLRQRVFRPAAQRAAPVRGHRCRPPPVGREAAGRQPPYRR